MEFEDFLFQSRPSPRAEKKEQTRTRILEEALELIRKGGEAAVTIRAVADAAGVSDRTVFRHFKNRDVLVRFAWRWLVEQIAARDWPQTADALIDRPRRLFPQFDDERELVRAYIHSPTNRAARKRPDRERQQAMLRCVREELVYLDESALRRRAAIAELITSPYAWELIQQNWSCSGRQAAQAAAEALEILLNRRLAY